MTNTFIPTFLLLTILSACTSMNLGSNKWERIEGEKTEITSHESIDEEDVFYGVMVSGVAKLNPIYRLSTDYFSMNMGLGFSGRYHLIKRGEINVDCYVPFVHRNNAFEEFTLPVEKTLLPLDFSSVISLPIYHRIVDKYRPVFAVNDTEEPESYFILTNISSYNKINARIGFTSDYKTVFTDYYSKQIANNSDFNYFFDIDDPIAQINQRNLALKLGGSYQICFNSNIKSITEKGMNLRGRRSQLMDFYFDINILVNHKSDSFDYHYSVDNELGAAESILETYSASGLMERQRLGFSMGYEIVSSGIEGQRLSSNSLEIGMIPGFYRDAGMSFYMKFSMKLGYGLWK